MGAGRLSDKFINTLHCYYGMTIRNNVGDLYGMKKSVWATLFHNCDKANKEERHKFALAYLQVRVCDNEMNLLLVKINIERNYLYFLPLNLC